MNAIAGLAALSVLVAAPAFAQDVGGPPPPPPPASRTTADMSEWRAVPAENLLVIETTRGRILVELTPEVAPLHVERIKLLARRGFYDNVPWHRVIDWFMAQTGDPLGNGEGQSPFPDLEAEFTFRRDPTMPFTVVAEPAGARLGFVRSLPIQTQPDAAFALTADGEISQPFRTDYGWHIVKRLSYKPLQTF